MKKLLKRILTTTSIAVLCTASSVIGVQVYDSVVANAETLGTYEIGLHRNEYDFRDNGVATGSGEKYLYLSIEGGESIPYSGDWSVSYSSDTAVKVNGKTMQGAMIKTYFAEMMDIPKENIVAVAITPCTAKKSEILLPNSNDTDFVVTTRELAHMIREKEIDFNNSIYVIAYFLSYSYTNEPHHKRPSTFRQGNGHALISWIDAFLEYISFTKGKN